MLCISNEIHLMACYLKKNTRFIIRTFTEKPCKYYLFEVMSEKDYIIRPIINTIKFNMVDSLGII